MSLHVDLEVPGRGLRARLDLAPGRTLALVGPNGAGKSSVLAAVAGALRTDRGEVRLDDRVLSRSLPGARHVHVPPHGRRVAMLGQDPHLFGHLTALGNVAFPLRAHGVARREAREEAGRLLAELGAGELAHRRPAQLSGGQQQRVAIARALAARPDLLLLDEPMAALDVEAAPAIRELLRRALEGRAAIVVTHDVLDALTLADEIAVLEGGAVHEQGPTQAVLSRPRSAFAARFVGLELLRGTADGDGLRLASGEIVAGRRTEGAVPGTAALAALRPSAVTLVAEGGLPRTVLALEPRGDLVRVRTEDLQADLSPATIAEQGVRPGSSVHLHVPAPAVTIYPAEER